MFWFFFFWLMNTVTPSISKVGVGGSGSRESRMSVFPTDRRQKAETACEHAHQSLHLRQPRQMIRSFEVQLSIFVRYGTE